MSRTEINNPAAQPVSSPSQSGSHLPLRISAVHTNIQQKMHSLAKRFITLLDALPQAGLVSQAEQGTPGADTKNPPAPEKEPFSAVLTGNAFIYSSPDAQDTDPARLAPATPVTVYQTVTGKEGPTGDHWYLISSPATPPRYVYAEWVRPQIRPLHQLLQDYFQVAERLWEAAAEDRLETWAASEEYSEAIERLERDVAFLEDACKHAPQTPKAKGARPWRRRSRLYKRALKDWQNCLGEKSHELLSDQTASGQALFRIRGRLQLASLNRYNALVVKGLEVSLVLASAMCIGMMIIFLSIARSDRAYLTSADLTTIYTAEPILAAIALALLLFAFMQPSLSIIIGYTLESTAENLRTFLLSWLRYVGTPVLPLLILAAPVLVLFEDVGISLTITFSNLDSALSSSPSPNSAPPPVLGNLANLLSIIIFYLIAIGGLIFPLTVTGQVALFRALKGNPERAPASRRSALTPAWKLFIVNSSFVLGFLGSLLNSSAALSFLGHPIAPFLPGFITWRQVIYLAVLLGLYGLLIEWPYHQGIARWQSAKLGELALTRKEIARQITQGEASSPEQPGRHTIQDDYALWQYYRAEEQEIADEPSWSLTIKKGSFVSLALILLSFAFEHFDTLQKALDLLNRHT